MSPNLQPLSGILVRPAQPADKTTVLEFCQHTWPNAKDYIAVVWDHWITDTSGQILVATLDNQPIAITRVVQLSDQEGWWEALRVDPRYRERGLFRCLEPAIEQYFQTHGISIVRCCVADWNTRMQAIVQRRNYQRVACYLAHTAEAIAAPLQPLRQLTEADCDQIWQFLDRSGQPQSPLFVSRGAKWQTLTIAQLRDRLQAGHGWGWWLGSDLQAVLIQSQLESADTVLWVGYVDGTTDGLPVLLEAMPALAHQQGYPKVSGFFLKDDRLLKVLQKAGYTASASDEYWVYEQQRSR